MWADIFKDAGWESPKFINAMLDDGLVDDFYTHEVAEVRLDKWSSGRVALLGDAAHCPSPATGMGTSSSIVGAYVLAGEITKYTNPKTRLGGDDPVAAALDNYEKILRPLIIQVQDHASGFWVPSSPWGIVVFNSFIGIAAWLRLDVLGKYILREDVNWTLPEYDELKELKLR
ncbi:uncharacterized protein TRUGW13939_05104 [Talaromyces rugulosus]|uniref:FAD-binding domain-containing protein n=1 Tax=Talaromyces rugulosus TaxID=121627 RepID=A0A7H8QVE0_TALRU|nr:uncharacterized protein TRUGW13939_05104 [Talaromyces rugulosus]QKX57984.1 hypothetical protein TRUGW13939_05104 [Talaromyces rugulosus]